MKNYFSDIIGNENIKSTLALEMLSFKSNHSFIIEGGSKSGKHTLALTMCKALMCTSRNETNFPCNNCENCKKVNESISTDIKYFNADEIQKDQAPIFRSEIIDTLKYYPNDSDYKVYIIENADRLNITTQNVLLKSIEEPPKYVVWILLTNDSHKLLETVISRCRILRMQEFTASEISEILKTKFPNYSNEDINLASISSMGSYGIAKNNLTIGIDKDSITNAYTFIKILLSDKKSEVALFLMRIDKKENLYRTLSDSLLYLRDIISVKYGNDVLYYPNKEDIEQISKKNSIVKLKNTYDVLYKSIEDIDNNVNLSLITATIVALAK